MNQKNKFDPNEVKKLIVSNTLKRTFKFSKDKPDLNKKKEKPNIIKSENDIKKLIYDIKKDLKIEKWNLNFNPITNNLQKSNFTEIKFDMDKNDNFILNFIQNSNSNEKINNYYNFDEKIIHYKGSWVLFNINKVKFDKLNFDDKDFEEYIKNVRFPSILQYEKYRFVISGGFNNDEYKSNKSIYIVELSIENNFLRIKNDGNLPKGLYNHNMWVKDEKLYIFGGNEEKVLINYSIYESSLTEINFKFIINFPINHIGNYYGYMFGLYHNIIIFTTNNIVWFSVINENFKILENNINMHGMKIYSEVVNEDIILYLIGGINMKLNRFDNYIPTKSIIKFNLNKNKKKIIEFLKEGRSYGICFNKLNSTIYLGGNNKNFKISCEYKKSNIKVNLNLWDEEENFLDNMIGCSYSKENEIFHNEITFTSLNKKIDQNIKENKNYKELFENIDLKTNFCYFGFLKNLNLEYFIKIEKNFSSFNLIKNDWGIFNFKLKNICNYNNEKYSIFFFLNELREFTILKYLKKEKTIEKLLINNEYCSFLDQFKYVFKNIFIANDNCFINYGRSQIFKNSHYFCLLFSFDNDKVDVLKIKIEYFKNLINNEENNLFNSIIPIKNDIDDMFYSKYIKEELINKNLNYLKSFFFSYKQKILMTFANSTNFFLVEILPNNKNIKNCLKMHYSISKGLFFRHDESESMDYLTIYNEKYKSLYIIYKDLGFIEIMQIVEGKNNIENLVNLYNEYDLILDPKREENLYYEYENEESFIFEKYSENYKILKDEAGLAHINNQDELEEILLDLDDININEENKNISILKNEFELSKMKWEHKNSKIKKKKDRILKKSKKIEKEILLKWKSFRNLDEDKNVEENEDLGIFFYPNNFNKNENLINKNLFYINQNNNGIIVYNNKQNILYEINYDTLEFKILKKDFSEIESKIIENIINEEGKIL